MSALRERRRRQLIRPTIPNARAAFAFHDRGAEIRGCLVRRTRMNVNVPRSESETNYRNEDEDACRNHRGSLSHSRPVNAMSTHQPRLDGVIRPRSRPRKATYPPGVTSPESSQNAEPKSQCRPNKPPRHRFERNWSQNTKIETRNI
jgi:hypothetical protein